MHFVHSRRGKQKSCYQIFVCIRSELNETYDLSKDFKKENERIKNFAAKYSLDIERNLRFIIAWNSP